VFQLPSRSAMPVVEESPAQAKVERGTLRSNVIGWASPRRTGPDKKRVPRPSRVLCERAGLFDGTRKVDHLAATPSVRMQR
jgi:hypothetical protein